MADDSAKSTGSTTVSDIYKYRISEEPWYQRNLMKWAAYDLGNTIFSMVVVSLTFVPLLQILYFGQIGDGSRAIVRANFAFSTVLLIGNGVMAVISPFLGAYADQLRERKYLLMKISMLCITFMASLVISAYTNSILIIMVIFFFSNLFYQMGLVVYDSILPFVTDKELVGKVSGLGVALGYFGSFIGIGLGFLLSPIFGDFIIEPINADAGILQDTFEIGYIPYIFPVAALMFLLFAIPMFTLKEKEREMLPMETDQMFEEVKRNTKETAREILNYRSMLVFLIGWLIYVDAANTVIAFMTPMVQVGLEFGEGSTVLIVLAEGILFAVLLTYPVGVYVDKNGPKKGLTLITVLWLVALVIAFFTNLQLAGGRTPTWTVFVFPILVGPALGGGWVVQRQFLIELAPPSKVANYFGFSNIFGRISAAIGPFIWSISIAILLSLEGFNINTATRYAIWVLAGLMILGYLIMTLGVDDVHDTFLKGGRARGDGTWWSTEDDEEKLLFTSRHNNP
ncbi:MAG: MFS transporter [Candidatus Kariarchaeaceae archaeon]